MPRARKPRITAEPNFNADFRELVKSKEGVQQVLDFMEVLTEIIDDIISQDETWFNLGRHKGNHTLLLTLHEGKGLAWAGGPNLAQFLSEFEVL